MRKLTSIILILFLSLLSSPSWSENLVCKYTGFNCPEIDDFEELIEFDGLYYKKFTDTPFTGKVIGGWLQGSFKNGKREGKVVAYYDNGQLWKKGEWENGKEVGKWVAYYDNGQLEYKGEYKNGEKEGEWVWYNKDGTLLSKKTY